MDAYHNYRGVNTNSCNHNLEVFSGFRFLINEGLQFIEGKSSNHVFNESLNTAITEYTFIPAWGIWWLEWRQAKDVMNFKDEFINVNTLIIDECETLQKSNSDVSRNRTDIFSVRFMHKEHIQKGTHIFILLEVFNDSMNLGEFFRLDVNQEFLYFLVIP